MKNYDVISKTALILNGIIEDLNRKIEDAILEQNDRENEFEKYSKSTTDNGTEYFKADENGELQTCSHWDYDYCYQNLKEAENRVQALKAVCNHVEGYKF